MPKLRKSSDALLRSVLGLSEEAEQETRTRNVESRWPRSSAESDACAMNYEIFNEYCGHHPPHFVIVRNADKYRPDAHGFGLASFLCFVVSLILCVVMVRCWG